MDINIIGMLTDCLEVTTSAQYFYKCTGLDSNRELTEEEEAEYYHIQNILSTEVSIYLTRRTSGCCGSIIDNLRGLRRQFIYEYEQKFKKQFIDYNSEVDF